MQIENWAGKFIKSTGKSIDVTTPHTNALIAQVPVSSSQEIDEIVQIAKSAQQKWSALTIKTRSTVLLKFLNLVQQKYLQELSQLIVQEHGKTQAEALADIAKGNETLEYAASVQNFAHGHHAEVSRGVFCRDDRLPLGVVVSIVPFNFPYMVPFWTIGHALVMGNAIVVKPSEKVPLTMNKVSQIWKEAGLPDGVFNLIHGTKETVESLIDHPDVKAVTFVGTSAVAEALSKRCSNINKRFLGLGGAKNHLVAAQDCDVQMTAQDVVNSFAGCSGQRCMAASVLLTIGERQDLLEKIVDIAGSLKPGSTQGCVGPVIDQQSLSKIVRYITEAEQQGAKLLLDGRGWKQDKGNWIGPTVILHSNKSDAAMKEEIFGPVLSVYACKTPQEAVDIQNLSKYGNAASIYTQDVQVADWFTARFQAGMLGVNLGVPVPREPFSFGGTKASHFGYPGDITGDSAIEFFSQRRKVTTKWARPQEQSWMS